VLLVIRLQSARYLAYGCHSTKSRRGALAIGAPKPFVHMSWLLPEVGFGVLGVFIVLLMLSRILSAAWRSRRIPITAASTAANAKILQACPRLRAPYTPCWFLPNAHAETVYAWAARRSPRMQYNRRCLILSDGGLISLDFAADPASEAKALPDDAPVLVILPGLTSGSHDTYPQWAAWSARRRGFRPVVFNARGTSNSPVATPQFYSASHTEDLRAAVRHLQATFPGAPVTAAGYSLGANILTRYLGEEGSSAPLAAAVSLCNPFNLEVANANLASGVRHVYNLALGAKLRESTKQHAALFRGHPPPAGWDVDAALRGRTIGDYDRAITIHVFGFESLEAYYANSSSDEAVPKVRVPLLCIQAQHDPIAPAEAIPHEALAANPHCVLAITPYGGHLGWVQPGNPRGRPWTDEPMLEFLQAAIKVRKREQQSSPAASSPQPATSGNSTQKQCYEAPNEALQASAASCQMAASQCDTPFRRPSVQHRQHDSAQSLVSLDDVRFI